MEERTGETAASCIRLKESADSLPSNDSPGPLEKLPIDLSRIPTLSIHADGGADYLRTLARRHCSLRYGATTPEFHAAALEFITSDGSMKKHIASNYSTVKSDIGRAVPHFGIDILQPWFDVTFGTSLSILHDAFKNTPASDRAIKKTQISAIHTAFSHKDAELAALVDKTQQSTAVPRSMHNLNPDSRTALPLPAPLDQAIPVARVQTPSPPAHSSAGKLPTSQMLSLVGAKDSHVPPAALPLPSAQTEKSSSMLSQKHSVLTPVLSSLQPSAHETGLDDVENSAFSHRDDDQEFGLFFTKFIHSLARDAPKHNRAAYYALLNEHEAPDAPKPLASPSVFANVPGNTSTAKPRRDDGGAELGRRTSRTTDSSTCPRLLSQQTSHNVPEGERIVQPRSERSSPPPVSESAAIPGSPRPQMSTLKPRLSGDSLSFVYENDATSAPLPKMAPMRAPVGRIISGGVMLSSRAHGMSGGVATNSYRAALGGGDRAHPSFVMPQVTSAMFREVEGSNPPARVGTGPIDVRSFTAYWNGGGTTTLSRSAIDSGVHSRPSSAAPQMTGDGTVPREDSGSNSRDHYGTGHVSSPQEVCSDILIVTPIEASGQGTAATDTTYGVDNTPASRQDAAPGDRTVLKIRQASPPREPRSDKMPTARTGPDLPPTPEAAGSRASRYEINAGGPVDDGIGHASPPREPRSDDMPAVRAKRSRRSSSMSQMTGDTPGPRDNGEPSGRGARGEGSAIALPLGASRAGRPRAASTTQVERRPMAPSDAGAGSSNLRGRSDRVYSSEHSRAGKKVKHYNPEPSASRRVDRRDRKNGSPSKRS